MRRPTLALLVALAAAGCAAERGTPPGPPAARSAAADGFTGRPREPAAPAAGGSKAAPYVLIGVAVGVGILLIALSNTSMMPDTSYPN